MPPKKDVRQPLNPPAHLGGQMVDSREIREALSPQYQEYHNEILTLWDRDAKRKATKNGTPIPPPEALRALATFWANKWLDLGLEVPEYITSHLT